MRSNMSFFVPETSYQILIDRLQAAIPKSLSMIGSLTNTIQGRLVANFYVDKWPEFSAVVCEYIWPRRSDVADIGAYATSSEALLTVLIEGNLVTWGKRQEFQRIEAIHADYLLAHLKQPGVFSREASLECIHERTALCYPEPPKFNGVSMSSWNKMEVLQRLSEILPDGFISGKLRPHHAEMVASQWPRLHDWPNKVPYFKELIESYGSTAIYSIENLDVPISYIVYFPCCQGFSYTDQRYKGKRFSLFNTLQLSTVIGDIYPFITETSYPGRFAVEASMGAFLAGYNVKDLIIKPHVPFDSKL